MPRLTEQEQQEIIRFIEGDKPLPDKYRFLLFEDKREVELVWNGKRSEVCNIALPFQVIEQVDEPRAEKDTRRQMTLFDLDARGRQLKGWTNKLIWGDNKLILSSVKNGPLREEIEKQGGIKLIYIDPPFDVGADFSMDIEIGDDTFTKQPSVLEEIAYRDTWGKGADSFIAMIYERLWLMRDLLAEDGSIYVHCDWRVNSFIRLSLDEIFGGNCQQNEIIWRRTYAHNDPEKYGNTCEPLAELNKTVTPVTSGVQKTLKNLDSGFRWNDVEGLLQEALVTLFYSTLNHRINTFGTSPMLPMRSHILKATLRQIEQGDCTSLSHLTRLGMAGQPIIFGKAKRPQKAEFGL